MNIIKIFKKNQYFSIIGLFALRSAGLILKYLTMFYLSSKLLDSTQFGVFSLYLVLLNFIYLFVGFGVIDSGMLLLTKNSNREMIGAALIAVGIICILFIIILIGTLYYYKFDYYILISLLSGGYIFYLFVKKISVGVQDKLIMYFFELSIFVLFLLLILIMKSNNVTTTIILYLIAMVSISIIFVIKLKPSFMNIRYNLLLLIENIKSYGIRIHISQFIAMSTYDLDKILLQYIYSFQSVGVYNLALNFIIPVKLFSVSTSEMMFRDFSKQQKITKNVFIINIIASTIGSIILTVIGYFVIKIFYDKSYYGILNIIYLLPILAILSCMYDPINYFFSAKGLSKLKLNNAIVLALCNIVFIFIFVPKLEVQGAMIATILALVVNNVMFFIQYSNYIRNSLKVTVDV